MSSLHPQYVTDDAGNRIAVMLPIDEFEELMEDMSDLAVIAERRDEPTLSHEEVVKQLRDSGKLED